MRSFRDGGGTAGFSTTAEYFLQMPVGEQSSEHQERPADEVRVPAKIEHLPRQMKGGQHSGTGERPSQNQYSPVSENQQQLEQHQPLE